MSIPLPTFSPREIVSELDRYIVGQADAKRAVAIALRNRWRRQQLEPAMANEVTPKNILMIGPTGVGKTEIARRLAKLAQAPFIKVEATKFTEVGYVGREVDSIIKDLADVAVKQVREREIAKARPRAELDAEERILDALLPRAEGNEAGGNDATRQVLRKKLREGQLDDREVQVEIAGRGGGVEIMGPPGMEEMTSQLQGLFRNMQQQRSKPRKLRVADALKLMIDEEAAKHVDEEKLRAAAVLEVEHNGIVFLDEIDKIAVSDVRGGSVSREGVQRDLLPLIEGTTVATKYGPMKTDHVLFIASGAFHLSKPSDMLPELQGRLPIRVELRALTEEDFVRILKETRANLVEQYCALIGTEDVTLDFTEDAITEVAKLAAQVNEAVENIGARRLQTMMERLLEDISFEAEEHKGETITIDAAYVRERLETLAGDTDLSKYIL